jgi:hypothetical protein
MFVDAHSIPVSEQLRLLSPCVLLTASTAGDRDLICNWLGNRRWVDQLQWEGSQGWSQAQDKAWMVKGQQAGLVTSYDTLSFLKVFQAVSVWLRHMEVQHEHPMCVGVQRSIACLQGRNGNGHQLVCFIVLGIQLPGVCVLVSVYSCLSCCASTPAEYIRRGEEAVAASVSFP